MALSGKTSFKLQQKAAIDDDASVMALARPPHQNIKASSQGEESSLNSTSSCLLKGVPIGGRGAEIVFSDKWR